MLLFILFGIGNAGMSIVIATTLITQWFPGPRAFHGVGCDLYRLSLGGVVLTPFSAHFMNH